MIIPEHRKLTAHDLEVLACAGASVTMPRIRALTGLDEPEILATLDRAAEVLPHYQTSLFQQATDPALSPLEQRLALDASRSISELMAWVLSLLPASQPARQAA